MAKQTTAVEWLVEELAKKHNYFQALIFYHDNNEVIKKAKQMEKDQIEMAHYHNRCIDDQSYDCTMKAFYDAQEYYIDNYEN
jgi:hypothetical protein